MDLEDLFKFLLPLIYFALVTLARLARSRRGRANKTEAPVASPSYETEVVDRYFDDEDDEHEEYEEESFVEVTPSSTSQSGSSWSGSVPMEPQVTAPPPRRESVAEVQERGVQNVRLRFADLFGSLNAEIGALFDRDESSAAPAVGFDEDEPYDRTWELQEEMARLEEERRRTLERAEHIAAPRPEALSISSTEVIRDAIVLDALFHRPKWGELPLRRERQTR